MNSIRTIVAFIKDKLTHDTSELLAKLAKLEAKVEAAIAKDLRKGETLVAAADNIAKSMKQNDSNLNAAYRLLHVVNTLGN